MIRPGRYPQELHDRAVRMVFEHQGEHPSQWAAITSSAHKVGVSAETPRKWVRRAEVDGRGSAVGRDDPRSRRSAAHQPQWVETSSAGLAWAGSRYLGMRTLPPLAQAVRG